MDNLWTGIENCRFNLSASVTTALLWDEDRQEVIAMPSAWHYCCTAMPWQCGERHKKCTAARRLMYWIHTMPPLSSLRSQQYAYCEGYAVGAVRRSDGLICWAIFEKVDSVQRGPGGEVASASSSASSVASGVAEAET